MTDLAEVLIGGRDIEVLYTGIRPGEKIHEIMVSEEECHRTIERNGYYVICPMLPECAPEESSSGVMTSEYSSADITLDHDGLQHLLAPYLGATLPAELNA
jgi:UDP-glucose 4-epimerase